jgi:hypothetical protein
VLIRMEILLCVLRSRLAKGQSSKAARLVGNSLLFGKKAEVIRRTEQRPIHELTDTADRVGRDTIGPS